MKTSLLLISHLWLGLVTVEAQSVPTSDASSTAPKLSLDLGAGESLELQLIQPGTFTQGSPADEVGREADETPRQVTLTKPYYLGVYPVTRGQFERFVISTKYRTEAERGPSGGFGVVNGKLVQGKAFSWRNPGFAQSQRDPVTGIAFTDAQAFCRWIVKTHARDCDLPSESQWEYACRAGTTGPRYAEPVDAVAWHRANSAGITHPVGSLKPNSWGLHNLYGSVWQWCADWYGPYALDSLRDPLRSNVPANEPPRRVLRGGSFLSDVSHSRSAERYRNDPLSRNADNGFRILCSVQKSRPAAAPPTAAVANQTSSPITTTARPKPSPQVPYSANHNSSKPTSFGLSIMGLLAPLGVLFVIARVVLKKLSSSSSSASTTGLRGAALATALSGSAPGSKSGRMGITTRLGIDGFWIEGPAEAAGQIIRYQYVVSGQTFANEVIYSPGPEGQFVFTGGTPTSASVMVSAAATGTTDDSDWTGRSLSSNQSHHSSSSSSHFPSAY